MNREILFRGKRVDNGVWVEGFYSNLFEEPTNKEESVIVFQHFQGADMRYQYPTCNAIYAVVDENTVGEFTGIIDTNGVKIFEDDIVSGISKNTAYVVRFENGAFFTNVCLVSFGDHTVIGNIHDNPELLK